MSWLSCGLIIHLLKDIGLIWNLMNKTALNICVQFRGNVSSFLWDKCPRTQLVGHVGVARLLVCLWLTLPPAARGWAHLSTSSPALMWPLVLPRPFSQTCWGYLLVALICISLVANDVGHLHRFPAHLCLLFGKWFMSFIHFPIGLLRVSRALKIYF